MEKRQKELLSSLAKKHGITGAHIDIIWRSQFIPLIEEVRNAEPDENYLYNPEELRTLKTLYLGKFKVKEKRKIGVKIEKKIELDKEEKYGTS